MVNLVLGLYAEGSGPHVSGFQGFSSKSGCLRPLHSRLSTVALETCSRGAASAWSALYARARAAQGKDKLSKYGDLRRYGPLHGPCLQKVTCPKRGALGLQRHTRVSNNSTCTEMSHLVAGTGVACEILELNTDSLDGEARVLPTAMAAIDKSQCKDS